MIALFFTLKGIVGVVSIGILLVHMNRSWATFDRDGDGVSTGVSQRMRFITLFYFMVLVTSLSVDQIQHASHISGANASGMVRVVLGAITAGVTLMEANTKRVGRH